MSRLAERVWPEVRAGHGTLAVPVGSLEQHGPHLPLETDTVIANAAATALCESLPDALLAPAVGYGASGEHEDFPGTVSIGHTALTSLLVEYGRSACRWTQRIVFVNGHGGNAHALSRAVQLLRYEGRDCAWLPCVVPGADAHAGHAETSLMLHVAPELVRMDRAAAGATEPITELMPQLRAGGVRSVTRTGVLGNPLGANAVDGARLFDMLIANARGKLRQWNVDANGVLS